MMQNNNSRPMKDIVAVATDAGTFTTFVKAIKAADLVRTLQGKGPFTVFAPSDAAFAKLPAGTLDTLLGDRKELAEVLNHHIVASRMSAAEITKSNGWTPKSYNGQPLTITVRAGKVYVDEALVSKTDITASNGVIHVLDSVLLPKAEPVTSGR